MTGHPVLIPSVAERSIRRRIARHGPVTFADYMAAALYGPGGYYTRAGANPPADYYTSPQVHPAFGALLAVQLFHLWTLLERPRPFTVLEPGAGSGLLGPRHSDRRQLPAPPVRQRGALRSRRPGPAARPRCQFHRRAPDGPPARCDCPLRGLVGCVLSNELLDAWPVHRGPAGKTAALRELYVAIQPDVADGYEGQLTEQAGAPSTPLLQRRLSDVGITLSDGQTAEICLLLDDWAASVAAALERGFVLTIDYGRAAADLYDSRQRPHGALVTYRGAPSDRFAPARCRTPDITAPVDFTSVSRAGERAGLATVGNVAQGWLLPRLGLQTVRRNGAAGRVRYRRLADTPGRPRRPAAGRPAQRLRGTRPTMAGTGSPG